MFLLANIFELAFYQVCLHSVMKQGIFLYITIQKRQNPVLFHFYKSLKGQVGQTNRCAFSYGIVQNFLFKMLKKVALRYFYIKHR